jgi:hypothetical protein
MLLAVVGFQSPRALSGANKNSPDRITLAGTTRGNTGCAILEKQMPVKGKLLLAGILYARTQYTVIQTFNAKLPQTKYTGPGQVRKLNQFATRNKIKLVVIPHKYAPDELKQARADCLK